MKKAIWISIGLALLAWAGCRGKNTNEEAKVEPPKPKIAAAERGPLVHSVEATGAVTSNLDVEIKCKASGEIVSLPFDVSDEVKKGELVLELSPVDERRNVDKAEVTVAAARARLEKAKETLRIARENLKTARSRANVDLDMESVKAADAKDWETRLNALYEQKIASAQAALDTAQAKADDAQAKANRARQLFDKKLVGKEELDTAMTAVAQTRADLERAQIAILELNAQQQDDVKSVRTSAVQAEAAKKNATIKLAETETQEKSLELSRQDVELARADLKSAEINLNIATQRLDETKVYAPIDGVVTSRHVQVGQIISSATNNVSGGTTVLTLSDLSRIYVVASVDESDIGDVRPGLEAVITADAYPDRRFSGVVDRIAPRGKNASNVVTFEVRIEVRGAGSRPPLAESSAPSGGGPRTEGKGFKKERGGPDLALRAEAAEEEKGEETKKPERNARNERGGGGLQAEGREGSGEDGEGWKLLKPEMTANVEIIISKKDDALYVPTEAVSRQKGKKTVNVTTGEGQTETREVETGISDGVNVEIVRGLKEGDKVSYLQYASDSPWSREGRMGMPMGGAMMRRH